ncbi:unnamed protein product [Citrullus colocynthis]|uniref:Uncharacterized protein n=1 Tax=Citrullus colocynthis TaxID=252529 RepID=A0ABP0YPJ0_9ROSI
MLFHFWVFEGLDIKGFLYFLEIWSLLLFGQIASSIEFVLFRKCLIGVSLSLEIFFWFPLSIALSSQVLLNDQHKCVMKLLYKIGVGSLLQLFKALLMQHRNDFLGETS